MKISAVIITLNEEKNIADAIRSLAWVDEVLVIDSGSTDKTPEIARSLGAKILTNPWPGFAAQKQFGVENAANDWILSIDADERVTGELAEEVKLLRTEAIGESKAGFTIPRLSYYMGRDIRHGGWYPDRQLRLFDRRRARWKDAIVHESVELTDGGEPGQLHGDILHYSVEDASHHHRMIGERYAPLSARQMFERGDRTSPLKIAVSAWAAFSRGYILKLGFLDGFPGFCIAYFAAHNTFMKHLLLWEMQKEVSDNASPHR